MDSVRAALLGLSASQTGSPDTTTSSSAANDPQAAEALDAGAEPHDADTEARDAHTKARDAGAEAREAGTEAREAGTEARDAGTEARDAGTEARDAGTELRTTAGAEARDAGAEARDAPATLVVRGLPGAGTSEPARPGLFESSREILAGEHAPSGGAAGLLLLFLLLFAGARGLRNAREALPREGFIPRLVGMTLVFTGVGLVFVSLHLAAALIPSSLAPALPWLVIAGAAALGWSSRDVLPDVVAGLVIKLERRMRVGDFITGHDGSGLEFSGQITALGFGATRLIDHRGHSVRVPNRFLLSRTIVSGDASWPTFELEIEAPPALAPAEAMRIIREAAATVAHAAPAAPTVFSAEGAPGHYVLRARALEARFIDACMSAIQSRAEEAFRARLAPKP